MDDESFMKVRADWICKNVVDEMRQEMVAVLLDYCQITVMVVKVAKVKGQCRAVHVACNGDDGFVTPRLDSFGDIT